MSSTVNGETQKAKAFHGAIAALTEFRRAFGRSLSEGVVAELYAARTLRLTLVDLANSAGFDGVDADGKRYQIKLRKAQNVDLNNFEFDFLVLVVLGDDYRLTEMWKMTVSEAWDIFTWRDKFRKFQTTQARVKKGAERII